MLHGPGEICTTRFHKALGDLRRRHARKRDRSDVQMDAGRGLGQTKCCLQVSWHLDVVGAGRSAALSKPQADGASTPALCQRSARRPQGESHLQQSAVLLLGRSLRPAHGPVTVSRPSPE